MEVIQPTDRNHWLSLRTKDLTSTEISALFHISPYMTEFELFHRKKAAEIVELEPNERMKWGTRLESAIALGVAEDNGWEVRPMKEYIRDEKLRIGASFDYSIEGVVDKSALDAEIFSKEKGLLEIKNVDSLAFRDGWIVDDNGTEGPPHIEIQVQTQLMVSERKIAYIGALTGGNKVSLLKRLPDASIHEAIRAKAAEFWKSIEENRPPAPNFERDAKFIAQLFNYADPGKVLMDPPAQMEILIEQYKHLAQVEKEASSGKSALKAEMLMLIGDAEKVKGDGWSISAGVIGPTIIEQYERKGYRDFRVFQKKSKNGTGE